MGDSLAKIRCAGCKKHKLEIRFSETARKKYRGTLAQNQRNPSIVVKQPRCVDCSVGNVTELTCVMCEKTMDLSRFAKTQRRNPDNAHCLNCQQEKVDREPNFEDEVEEQKILAEATGRLNMNGSRSGYSSIHSQSWASRTGRSDFGQSDTASNDGSVTSSMASRDWGHGNAAIDLASVTSRKTTSTGWDSFEGGGARSVASTTSTKGGNAGFAKQKAVGKTASERADATIARNQNWQTLQDDDGAEEELTFERDISDNDSDGDDPY